MPMFAKPPSSGRSTSHPFGRFSLLTSITGPSANWWRDIIKPPTLDMLVVQQAKDQFTARLHELGLAVSIKPDERTKWGGGALSFNAQITRGLIVAYQAYKTVVPQGISVDELIRQLSEVQGLIELRALVLRLLQALSDTIAIRCTVLGQTTTDLTGMLLKQADDEAEAGAVESVAIEASTPIVSLLDKIKQDTANKKTANTKYFVDGQQNLDQVLSRVNDLANQNDALKQEVADLQHKLTLSTGPGGISQPAKPGHKTGHKAAPGTPPAPLTNSRTAPR